MIAHTYPSTRFSPAISYSLSVSASSPITHRSRHHRLGILRLHRF